MKLFSFAKKRSGFGRTRGAAMPEAVVVFPVLLIIFSASIAAGKLHRAALTSQHDARREVHRLCLAPVLDGAMPASFPPSTETTSSSGLGGVDLPAPPAPPAVFATVPEGSGLSPSVLFYAGEVYNRITAATTLENSFVDARSFNSIRRKESSFANGYFATTVNTKGAAFFMCENGLFAPARPVDSDEIVDALTPYAVMALFSRMTLGP